MFGHKFDKVYVTYFDCGDSMSPILLSGKKYLAQLMATRQIAKLILSLKRQPFRLSRLGLLASFYFESEG